MAEYTDEEWKNLRKLVCKVENGLKTVFGAALCNWNCLMNGFCKKTEPNPHLHIHVRPWYAKPVSLNGNVYSDGKFAHHYAVKKNGTISDADRQEVFVRLKEWMEREK